MKTDTDFTDRRQAAENAKAALLEKMKARRNDPGVEARRAERAAIVAAREEREAAKRLRREQEQAEAQARQEAEREAADERAAQSAASEQDRLIAQALEDQAAQKAKRDARYAARQTRKS